MPNIDQVQLPDGSQYNLRDNISGYVTAQYVNDVIDGLTKADVGLGNVDNTSDLNKPVSTAQQTALNGKTDTTVIAPTEATTTASRRYEIGEQFILNGVLYTATAVIASGDTIIVNTNCDLSENITGQIKEVNAKGTPKTDIAYVETGTTASRAYSVGQLIYVNGTLYVVMADIASGATFTVGTNIKSTSVGKMVSENCIPNQTGQVLLTFNYSQVSGYSGAMIPFLIPNRTVTMNQVIDISSSPIDITASCQLVNAGSVGYLDGSYIIQASGSGYNGHQVIAKLTISD